MSDAFVVHGGDLAAARAAFPKAPEPWLDLSTGINRRPYPMPRIDAEDWARLPDPAGIAALEAAAAQRYGVAAPAEVVAAPGTQAIIQALPLLFPGRRVAVLGPTYAEHERAWAAAGADVQTSHDVEPLGEADVAVVVNPNNPDGRLVPRDALLALAARLAGHGGRLVVDEAFVDLLDADASLVPVLPKAGVVALRSFGKTYGLAGLRLGFAVAGAAEAATLRRAFGPWAVSTPALAVGRAALADDAWLAAARRRLAEDADAFDALLSDLGFAILGRAPLFRLAARADAPDVFLALARSGILVRPFVGNRTWLRFGIPCDGGERARVRAALREIGLPIQTLVTSIAGCG